MAGASGDQAPLPQGLGSSRRSGGVQMYGVMTERATKPQRCRMGRLMGLQSTVSQRQSRSRASATLAPTRAW